MGGIGSKSEADAFADLDLAAEFSMLADISDRFIQPEIESIEAIDST